MAGATTDFVGVRVFSNLGNTIAKIDTRDSTVIGIPLPAPLADNTAFPIGEPVAISTDNPQQIARLGAGIARDAIDQIAAEGIVTDIAFVRTQHSPLTDPAARLAPEINAIVGSAGAKTGVWALLEAKDHLGIEPGCIIIPGYDSQRLGNVANPAVTAAATVADRIIDCIVIANTPSASREAAAEYAADFATLRNVVALYPQVMVNLGAGNVVRPMSPSAAGAMVRNDKLNGNPYKAFWNKPLAGVLAPSVKVNYRDGDTSSDANWLNQRGVGTIIEKKLLWAPFTTATDPTVNAYRSIKMIRTRRAIEKAPLKPLRQYLSGDMTPDTVNLIYRALDQFLMDLVTAKALIDYELIFDKRLNPAALLQAGAIRVKPRFQETPDLVDLQIYTETMPEAFDALALAMASALSQLGLSRIRVAG